MLLHSRESCSTSCGSGSQDSKHRPTPARRGSCRILRQALVSMISPERTAKPEIEDTSRDALGRYSWTIGRSTFWMSRVTSAGYPYLRYLRHCEINRASVGACPPFAPLLK